MAFFEWNSSYFVGVAEIDSQHARLVNYINDLHDAMLSGKGKEQLGKTLAGLVEYTRTHFAYEEKLMAQYVYPTSTVHKNAHDKLTAQVIDLEEKYRQGKVGLTLEVMKFLSDWLSTHIMQVDKQFGQYLNKKGVH